MTARHTVYIRVCPTAANGNISKHGKIGLRSAEVAAASTVKIRPILSLWHSMRQDIIESTSNGSLYTHGRGPTLCMQNFCRRSTAQTEENQTVIILIFYVERLKLKV